MKKAFFLGMVLCAFGMFTSCSDELPLGDGYVFIQDYPYCVGKKTASVGVFDIILPPTEHWHDSEPPGCADIAVNVYWDDTTVLAVCCYCDVMAKDTTCWKLNKKTGHVQEITPENFLYKTNQGEMHHTYVLRRYKQNNN